MNSLIIKKIIKAKLKWAKNVAWLTNRWFNQRYKNRELSFFWLKYKNTKVKSIFYNFKSKSLNKSKNNCSKFKKTILNLRIYENNKRI